MSLPTSSNGKGSSLSQECDVTENDSCSCYNIHIQVAESKSEIDLRIEPDVPHKHSPHRTVENAAVGSKSAKHAEPHKVTIFTDDKSMDNVHIEYKYPKNNASEGMKEHTQTHSKEKGKCHELQPQNEDVVSKSYHYSTDDRRREENRYRQEAQEIRQNDHKRPLLRTRTVLYTKREVKNPREAVARLEARQGLFSRSIQQYVIRAVDLCTTPFTRNSELREEKSKSKTSPEIHPKRHHHKSEAGTTSLIEDNKTNNLSQESDGKYKGQLRDKRFRIHIDDLNYKKVDNSSEFIRKNNEKKNSGTESKSAELEQEITSANKSNEQSEIIISQYNSSPGKNFLEVISNTKTPELHNIRKGKFREKIDTSQNLNKVEDSELFKDYSEKLDKEQDSNRQIFHDQNVSTKCEKTIYDTSLIDDEKSPVKRKKRRLEDSPSRPKEKLKLQENINKTVTRSKDNVKSQRKFARRKTRSKISKLHHFTTDSSETDKDHEASFLQERSLSASPICKHSSHRKKFKHRGMSPKNQQISPQEMTEESYQNYIKTHESKDQLNKDALDAPINKETSNSKSAIPNKQENQKNTEIIEIFDRKRHFSARRRHSEKQDKFPVEQYKEGTNTSPAFLVKSAKPKKKTGDISQNRIKSNEVFMVHWFTERNSQQEKSQVVEEGGETEESSSEKDDDNSLTQEVFYNQNHQNHHVEQKQDTQMSKSKDAGINEDNKTTKYNESLVQEVKYDTKDPDVAEENTEDTPSKDDLRNSSTNINNQSSETIRESSQQKIFGQWQENAHKEKQRNLRHSDSFISYKELAANRRRKKRYSKYKKRSSQGSCRDMMYSVERGRTPPRSRKKRSQEPRRKSVHQNITQNTDRENNTQACTSRTIPEKIREDSISRRERSKSKNKEGEKKVSFTRPDLGDVGQYIKLEVPENRLVTRTATVDKKMRPAMLSKWQCTKPEIPDNEQFTRLEIPNKRQLPRPEISDGRQLTRLEMPDKRQHARPEISDSRQLRRLEMPNKRQLSSPETSDNEQFTRLEMPDKRQLARPEISDSRQLTRLEMPDKRQLSSSETSDNEQFIRLEMPDKQQLTRPEISDSRQLTRPEISDSRQLTRPEISDSRQLTRPEISDSNQLTKYEMVENRQLARPEISDSRRLTKYEMLDNRLLARPEISDSRQFTRPEIPDSRQFSRPEISDSTQFTRPEISDSRQFSRPEISDSTQFTRPEISDSRQLTRSEISDSRQLTKSEMLDNRQLARPEISDSRQLTRPEMPDNRQLARPEISDSRQLTKSEIPDNRQLARPEISDSRQLTRPEMPDNRQLTRSEISDSRQLTKSEIPDNRQLARPEISDSRQLTRLEMPDKRHLTKPEVTGKMQFSRPEVIADRRLTRPEITEKRQLAEPETDQRCEIADARHYTRPEVIIDRPTRPEITDRRQLTGPETSDHRQLPRSETADERQLTRPEILEVRRPTRPKIPDKRRFKKFNEKPDKRKLIRPEKANEKQFTRRETAKVRQLTRPETATERQLTRPETATERQLTRPETANERQLTRPETANERQLTRPETANERQLTRPEVTTERQLTRRETANERQLTRPEIATERQLTRPETATDRQLTRREIATERQLTRPETATDRQLTRPEIATDRQLTRPETATDRQLTRREIATERQLTRPETATDRQLTRREIATDRQLTRPEIATDRQLTRPEIATERQLTRPEIATERQLTRPEIATERQLTRPEIATDRQLTRPEIATDRQLTRPEIATDRQLTRPEIANEQQLLRPEKAYNGHFTKFETVDDECHTRSEIPGSKTRENGGLKIEKSLVRQDVSFKTKQHKKHYITKSKQSRKNSFSGSLQLSEKIYKEKETKQVKSAQTKVLVSMKTNSKNTVTANKQPERYCVSANTSEDKTQTSDASNAMKGETKEESQEVKGLSSHKSRNKIRKKDQTSTNKHRPLGGTDETNLKSNTPSHLKESSCQNFPKISENKPDRNNQNQMPGLSDNIQKAKWERKNVAYAMTATTRTRIELSAQRAKNITSDKCTNSEEKTKMCKRTTDSDKSQRSATGEIKEKDILAFQTPLGKRKSTSTPPKRTEKSETVKPLSSPSDRGKKPPEMEKKDDKDVSKGNIKQKDEEVNKSIRRENSSLREPWRSPGYQPRTSQSCPRRRKERADMSWERKTGTVILEPNYLPRVDESSVEESLQFLRDSFEGRNKIPNKESTILKERATSPAISPQMHSKQAQKSTQLPRNFSKRQCSNSSAISRQSSEVNKNKLTALQQKKSEKEEQIILNETEVRKLNCTSETVQRRTQSRQRNCDVQRLDVNTSRKKSPSPKSSPHLVKRKFVRNEGESSRMTSNHERKKVGPNAGKSPERTKTIEKETVVQLKDIPSKMLIITLQDPKDEKQSSYETNRNNDMRGEILYGPNECKGGSSQETGNGTSISKCGTEMMDNSEETIRESTENTSQGVSFFFHRNHLPGEIVEGTHNDNKRLVSERTFIKRSSDDKKIWNGRYEYLNTDNTDSSFGRQPPDNNAPGCKSSRVLRSARENKEENKMCSTDDTEIQSYNNLHKKSVLSRSSTRRLPNKKQSRSRKHEEIHDSHTSNVVERRLSKSDHKNLPVVRSANKWVSDKQSSHSRTRCLHKTFTVSETDRTLEDSQSHSLDAIQSSIHWVSNKTELPNRKSEDINNIVEIQLSNGDKDYLSGPLNITNWLQNKQSSFCRTPVNKSYTITNVEKQPPNHDEEKHTNEFEPSRKHSPSKKPSDAEKDNVKENHFTKSRYQELLDEIQAEMNQLDVLGLSHINSIKGRRQVKSIIIPLKQAGDSNNFSSIELPEKRSIILPITDGSMNYLLSRHKLHHPANNPPPQIQVHYVTVARKRNSSSETSSSFSSSDHNLRYRSVSRDRKSLYRLRELNSNVRTSEGSLSNEEERSAPALVSCRRRKTPERAKKQRHGSKKNLKSSKETESQDRPVSRNRSIQTEYESPSRYEKCPSASTRSAAVGCAYPDEEDEIRSCFPVHSRHRPKRKAMYDPLAQPNSRRIPRRRSRRSSSTCDTCSVPKHGSRTTVCSKKSTCSRKSRRSRKHHRHHRHRRHLCDDNDDSETCSIHDDETECDECIDKTKSSDSDVPPRRSQRADYPKCPYRPPSVTLNYCELTYSSDSTQTSHRSPSAEAPRFNREPENSRSLGLSIKPSPIHEHGRATVPSRRADQKSRKAIKASNSQDTATSAVASDVAAYGTSSDDYERVRKLKNTKKGGNVYSQYNVQTNVVPSFTSSLYDTLLFNNKYTECKEIFRHPKFLSSSSGKLNEHLSAEELGSFSFKRQDETTNQDKLLQMKLKNCLNKNYSEFECPKISQDENKFCKSFSEFSENGRKSVSLRYTKEALESFNRALKALPTTTKSTECDRQDPGVQDNKAIELQVMKDRHQNMTELASSPQIPLQEGIQYRRNKNNPRQRFTGKEQKGKNSNLIKSASKLTLNLFPLNAPKSTIVYMAGQVRNSRSSKQKKNVDKRERCKCPKCQKVQKTSQQPCCSAKETDKNVACMNRQTPKEVEPPVSVLYTRGKTNNMTSKPPEHAEVHFEEVVHFVEGSDHSHDGNERKDQVKQPCQLKLRKKSLVELFRNNTTHRTPSQISLSDEKVYNINIRCECRDKRRQDKDYEKFHASAEVDSSKMKKNMGKEAKISSSDSNASFTSLSSKMSFTPSGNLPPCSGNCQIPEDVLVSPPKPHSNIPDEKLLANEYGQKDDETTYGQVKELNDVLEKDKGKEKCEDISLCEERACREQAIKMKAEKQKQDQRKQKEYKNQKHSYHSEDVSIISEEDIKTIPQDALTTPTHSDHSEDVLIEHTPEEDVKSISQHVSVSPTHLEDVPKEHVKPIIKPVLKDTSTSLRHSNDSDDVLKDKLKEHIKFISQEAFRSSRHSSHSGDVLKDHIPKEHIKATSKEASTSPRHFSHAEDVLKEHTPEEHVKAISKEASPPRHSYHSEDLLIEHTPEEHVEAISKETSTSPRHSNDSEDVLKEHIPKEHIKSISKEASTPPRHSNYSEEVLIENTPKEHVKAISQENSASPSYNSGDFLTEPSSEEWIKPISKEPFTSPTLSHNLEDVLKVPTHKEHIKAISKEADMPPRHSYHSQDVLEELIPEEHIKAISKEACTSLRHSHHSEEVFEELTPKEHIKSISKEASTSPRQSYHSEDVLKEHIPKEQIKSISKEASTPRLSYHSEDVLKEHIPKGHVKSISKEASTLSRHSRYSEEVLIENTPKEHVKSISKEASTSPGHSYHSEDVLTEHIPKGHVKFISKEASTPKHSYHSEDVLTEHIPKEHVKSISKEASTSPRHSRYSEEVLKEHIPKEHVKSISKEASTLKHYHSEDVLKEHIPKEHVKSISKEASTSPRHSYHSEDVLKEHIPKEHIKSISKEASTPRLSYHSEDVLKEHIPKGHVKSISKEASTLSRHSRYSEEVLIENTPKEHVKSISKEASTSPGHSYHSEDVLTEHIPKGHVKFISKEASTPKHSYHSEDVLTEHIPKEHVKSISKEASTSPRHSRYSEEVLKEHIPKEHVKSISKEASTLKHYHSEDVLKEHIPKEHVKSISKEASTSPRHSYHSEDVLKEHIPKEHIKSISKEASTSPRHSYHSEDVLKEHIPKEHIKSISKEASTSPRHSYHSEDVLKEHIPKEHIKSISKEASTSPRQSYHSEDVLKEHIPNEQIKSISKEASTPRQSYHSEDVLKDHIPKEHIKSISKEASTPRHSYPSEDVLKEHIPKEHIKSISKEASTPRHSYHSEDVLKDHIPKEHVRDISQEDSTTPRHSYHSEDFLIEPTSEEWIKATSKEGFTSPTDSHHSEEVLKEPTPEEDSNVISKEGSISPAHSHHSKEVVIEPIAKEHLKAISQYASPPLDGNFEYISKELQDFAKRDFSSQTNVSDSEDHFEEIAFNEDARNDSKKAFSTYAVEDVSPRKQKALLARREIILESYLLAIQIAHVQDVVLPSPEVYYVRSPSLFVEEGGENSLMVDTKPFRGKCDCIWCTGSENEEGGECCLPSCMVSHLALPALPQDTTISSLSIVTSSIESVPSIQSSQNTKSLLLQEMYSSLVSVKPSSSKDETAHFLEPEVPTQDTLSNSNRSNKSDIDTKGIPEPRESLNKHQAPFHSSDGEGITGTQQLGLHETQATDETRPTEKSESLLAFRAKSKSQIRTKENDLPRNSFPQKGQSNGNEIRDTSSKEENQFPNSRSSPPSSYNKTSRTSRFLSFTTKKTSQMSNDGADLPDNSVPQKGSSTAEEIRNNVFDTNSQEVNPLPTNNSSTPSIHNKSSISSGHLPFRIKKKSQTSIEDTNLPDNSVPQNGQCTCAETGDNVFRIISKEKQSLPSSHSFTASGNNKSSKTSGFLPFRTKKRSQTSIEESDLPDNSVTQKEQSTDNEIRSSASNTSNQRTNWLPNNHSFTASSNNKCCRNLGCLPFRTKKKSQTSIEDNELPHNSVPQEGPSATEKNGSNSKGSHEIHALPTGQSFTPYSYNQTARSTGQFPFKTKRKSQVNNKNIDLPDDSTSQSSAQDMTDNSILETPQLSPDHNSSSRSESNSRPSSKRHRSGSCTIINSPEGEIFLHFCPKHSDETIQVTPDTSDTQMDNKTLKKGVFEVVSLQEKMPFVTEIPSSSEEKPRPLEQQNEQHNISANKCQTGNRDEWHFCPLYPESYSAVSSEEILITTAEEIPKSWSEASNISTNFESERGGRPRVQVYHIIPDDITNVFQLKGRLQYKVPDFSDSNDELISSCDLDKSKSAQTVDGIAQGSDTVYSVVPDSSKVKYSIENQGENKKYKTDKLCLYQPFKERNSSFIPLAYVNSAPCPEVMLNTVPIKNDPSLQVTQKSDSSKGTQNNFIQTPTNSNLKSDIQLDFDHRDTDSSSNKLTDGNHVKNSAEEEIQSLSNFLEELEVWQSQVSSEISLYFKLLNKDPSSTSIQQLACSSTTADRVKKANVKENGTNIIGASGQQSSTDNGQGITTNEGFSYHLPFSRSDERISCVTNSQNNSFPEVTTASQQFQELSTVEKFSNLSSFSRPGESIECITTTQINSLPELIITSQELQKPSSLVGYIECDGIEHEGDKNTKEEAGCSSAYYSNSVPLVYSFKQEYVIADRLEIATSPGRANLSPRTENIIHACEGVIQPINPRNRPQLVLVSNIFSAKENMKIVEKLSHKVPDKKTDKTENDLGMYYYSSKGTVSNNQYECSFENRENEYSQDSPEVDDVRIFSSSENVELIDVALGSSADNITKVEVHSTTQKKQSLLPEGKSLDLLLTINGSSVPETQVLHQNIFKYDTSVTSTSTDEVLETLSKPEISSFSINYLQSITTETEDDYSLKSHINNENRTTREKFIKEMEDTSSKTDDTSNRIMKNYGNSGFELNSLTLEKGTNEQFRNETKIMNESGSSVYTTRQNKQCCTLGSDEELLTLSINTSQNVTFSIDVIESGLSITDNEKDKSLIYFKVPGQESGKPVEQPDILNDFEQITDFSKNNNKEDTAYLEILENMYTIPKAFDTEIPTGNSKTITNTAPYSPQAVTLLQSNSGDFLEDTTHESTRRQIQAAAPQANMKRSPERSKKFGLDKDLLSETADHLLPQTEREQVKNSHPKSQNVKKKVHIKESSNVIIKRKKEDVGLSVKNLDHSKHTLVPVAKKSSSSNKSRRNVRDSERERDDLNTPKEAKLKKKVFFGLLGGWSQHHKIDKSSSGSRHDVPSRVLSAKSRSSTSSGSAGLSKNCEDSKKDRTAEPSTSTQASRMFWPSCVKKIVQAPKKGKNQGSRENSR